MRVAASDLKPLALGGAVAILCFVGLLWVFGGDETDESEASKGNAGAIDNANGGAANGAAANVGAIASPANGSPAIAYAVPAGPEPPPFSEYHVGELRSGDSLSTSTLRLGMTAKDVDDVVGALKPVFDFRKAQPGQVYEFWRGPAGELSRFRYRADEETTVVAFRGSDGAWSGFLEPVNVVTATVTVAGEVKGSLYLSMDAQGERPWLTLTLVDMFSWDIDFFTETHEGDAFRILVEKRFKGDQFLGYGRVLGAEYARVEGAKHRAFRYELLNGSIGYYDEQGKALEKAFLKSPIKFASITSRYGLRKHPILKYVRAHKGVDYAAPRGTAIWAMGDGVVSRAGWAGGYGRLVAIRHTNGLETRYAHLSGFGPGIRAGVRVRQKQTIGYLGMSGLATGPHLHFEVLRGGRHTNPLTVAAPPAPPIPAAEKARFAAAIAPIVTRLDAPVERATAALAP